jgi:hypothetical protein
VTLHHLLVTLLLILIGKVAVMERAGLDLGCFKFIYYSIMNKMQSLSRVWDVQALALS